MRPIDTLLRSLDIVEDEAYLERKLKDNGRFAARLYLFGAFLGLSLWGWDYVTDPIGAKRTWTLRLFFLVLAVIPLLFKKIENRRLLTICVVGLTLMTEIVYLLILNRLEGGMVYGLAGFMFYMMVPSLAFVAFSFLSGLIYILLAALLPHLLAMTGIVPGFSHLHYAVLIWPAAILSVLIEYTHT